MTDRPGQPPLAVTVVHAPACHFCEDAESALSELAQRYDIEVRTVELESQEGRALVAHHRPGMNPLVLLDGAFFSAGRLPRKKLAKVLDARGRRLSPSPAGAPQAHDGL